MNGKIRLAACSVLLLVLLLWAAPVLAVPPIPHAYYGTVTINTQNAIIGTVVSATINGVNAGSCTTTVAGQYGSVAQRDYLAVGSVSAYDGDTITFYVNGTSTGQTATFEVGGGPTQLNLTVTIAAAPVSDGGGIGGAPAAPAAPAVTTVTTTVFGSATTFSISSEGEIQETFTATSEDGNLTMTIPEGTIALDKDGDPLGSLTAVVDASPPDPPEGAHVIGLAYDFEPDGATFDPAITLTWSYDPDALPEGVAEEDLVIAYYDEDAGEWVALDSVIDTENNTITASVEHFTIFAIIGAITPPAPAAFSVSNLSIQPAEVQPEEAVTITVAVANTGGTEGSYVAVLKINGVKEADKSVTVAAGGKQTVAFSVTRKGAGKYTIAVDGLSGSFTVHAPVVVAPLPPPPAPPPEPPPPPPPPAPAPPISWPIIGGIVAALIVVVLLLVFLVRRRRTV